MRCNIPVTVACTMLLFGIGFATEALADVLTQRVQQDLVDLGYAPGNVEGEATTETAVAIAKYEAEHDMEVTGAVTPQLAGILSAAVSQQDDALVVQGPEQDPAVLREAQQACLQEKVAASQASQKKKRGVGRLLSMVRREAARSANSDLYQTTNDVYHANATAADLSAAAKDLGLTEDEVAACQNPDM